MSCPLCREDVPFDERAEHYIYNEQGVAAYPHWYCALREVLGGIGHFTDCAHWCKTMHDPDAGLSRRESARRVGNLVRQWGPEQVADWSTEEGK